MALADAGALGETQLHHSDTYMHKLMHIQTMSKHSEWGRQDGSQ